MLARLLFCCFVFMPTTSIAESNWKAMLITGDFDVGSKAERQTIANGLLAQLQPLSAYAPNLTSEQTAWLEKEIAALNKLDGEAFMQKANSIERSPEQQLKKLNAALDNVIKALECAANDVAKSAVEIWCWGYVNLVLTDSALFNEAIYFLSRSGMLSFNENIKKQFFLTYASDDPWGGYHILGRAIQERIVLPMLQKRELAEPN